MKKLLNEILANEKVKESAVNRMNKYTKRSKDINKCWEWQGHCNEKGYAMLSIGGRKGLYARVSRLVYYIYFGPFNEDLFVCHKCDNPKCVNPNHLFLGTPKDNTKDMYNKSRQSLPPTLKGEESSLSKITEEDVHNIYNSSKTPKELSEQYNISTTHVYRILKGEVWQHLNLEPKVFKPFVPTSKKKLSDEDVRFIRESNKKNTELAKQFNCDPSHIGKIKKYKARANVK